MEKRYNNPFDDVIQKVSSGKMWGSVLIGLDEETVFESAYGKRDHQQKENCDSSTLYELASLSKQFTATAILHLQQNGKLNILDSIKLFFKVPDDKEPITLHHLLVHTAGLSKEIGVPYNSKIDRPDYVDSMLQHPLATPPGIRFEYSNVGYALLAAVIEQVTQQHFQEYLRENLFIPSRMLDTGFIGDVNFVKTKRVSRRKTDDSEKWTAVEWHHYGWGYKGMGGAVSTVLDLKKWSDILRSTKILNEKMKEILFTPVLNNHACGWRIKNTARQTRKAEHSGGVAGYGNHMVHFLDENAVIVILSNDEMRSREIALGLESILFE